MNWESYLKRAINDILTKKGSTLKLQGNRSSYNQNKIKVLAKRLNNKTYKFSEWEATSLPKKDGGYRVIIIPPFNDRIVLRALASYLYYTLKPSFEKVDDVSFAYQKGKGVRDAIIKLKSLYSQGDVILKVDICKFFDNINKKIAYRLLEGYKIDRDIVSLIKQSFSPQIKANEHQEEALLQIKNGIPLGNAISAVISNLILLDLDMQCKSEGIRMIRYADDMVFICHNENEARNLLNRVTDYLKKERMLTIHPLLDTQDSKTIILSNLKQNKLVYLGIEFDGDKIKPTKECKTKFISRVFTLIKKEKAAQSFNNQEIEKCIAQWCGYYAFTDITETSLVSISKQINNRGEYSWGTKWKDINLITYIEKSRRKQNRTSIRRYFSTDVFGEEYAWLICY